MVTIRRKGIIILPNHPHKIIIISHTNERNDGTIEQIYIYKYIICKWKKKLKRIHFGYFPP
jgi:hypothetical protein